MIYTEAFDVFWSPPFVERAVTEAPLTAFVPISILTEPVEAAALERFPRSMTPLPATVILRTGRTRARTWRPLIVPVAVAFPKTSHHTTGEESPPLPTTVPVPIFVAANDDAAVTIIPAASTPERSFLERLCICVFVMKYNAQVY